jgi:hypothetical protein
LFPNITSSSNTTVPSEPIFIMFVIVEFLKISVPELDIDDSTEQLIMVNLP